MTKFFKFISKWLKPKLPIELPPIEEVDLYKKKPLSELKTWETIPIKTKEGHKWVYVVRNYPEDKVLLLCNDTDFERKFTMDYDSPNNLYYVNLFPSKPSCGSYKKSPRSGSKVAGFGKF